MEETFSVANSTHSRIVCLLAAFAVAVLVLSGALRAQQPAAPQLPRREDPQARQMLDRAVQALGGQALKRRQTLVPVSKTTALGCAAPLPLR